MLDRSNQPWAPREHPELDWVEGVPRHRSFDDIYYSASDGRAESQHVFIDGSGVREKLAAGSLVVAETGFGTGLNFLLALQAWRHAASSRKAPARLRYIGLEAQPMTRQQLQQALAKWPELQLVADRLLAAPQVQDTSIQYIMAWTSMQDTPTPNESPSRHGGGEGQESATMQAGASAAKQAGSKPLRSLSVSK